MSTDYCFYAERFDNRRWTALQGLDASGTIANGRGEFVWLNKSYRAFLFWQDPTPLLVQRGLPPEDQWSDLLIEAHQAVLKRGETCCWWSMLDWLLVDQWPEMPLLLTGKVPRWAANLFGDGQRPFPRTHVEEAAIDADQLDRYASPASTPINAYEFSHFAHEPHTADPTSVSWQTNVAAYLGEEIVSGFKELRRHDADERVRIIGLAW